MPAEPVDKAAESDPENVVDEPLSPQQVRERLVAHLRRHAIACGSLGSPLYAALMADAADDLAADGPVAVVLAGHDEDPVPAALGLRLMGTVHRVALAGEAPDLGRFYPSVAGAAAEPFDPGRAWAAFRAVLTERPGDIRAGLATPPQTNEVGRSAALIGGLLHVRERFPLPVRLVEIGASAGLNLRADHMRVALYGGGVGPADSPVVLHEPWRGPMPPIGLPVEIVERLGSDLDPVDVGTLEGRLRLMSFVWPDQPARLARLRGAFVLAEAVPATLVAARAQATVEALRLAEGAATVIWHSFVWQYVEAAEQAAITARLELLGETATPRAPLVRLSFEPRGRRSPSGVEFVVRMRTWPGEGVQVLATGHPHGDTVVWRRLYV